MMKYILFEDAYYKNLLPLVYFRPVWQLRCGALTLEEKFVHFLGNEPSYLARNYLMKNLLPEQKHYKQLNDEEIWLVNGRWVFQESDLELLQNLGLKQALVVDQQLVAARVQPRSLSKYLDDKTGLLETDRLLEELELLTYPVKLMHYLWDAIDWNGEELENDFRAKAQAGQVKGKLYHQVAMLNPENIFIAHGARVKPGAVLDADEGPIWIDEEAEIMPNAVVRGPAYIGKKSRIKIGAKIYENTSIGPVCKVGGEVEGSIIHSYSNKQHDGFLGHAYLGSWINIGADTNNSDLKNNYGPITVMLNGEPIPTGKQFLGLMMGDHSKCAINTMFNTGTIVGVSCNIFGAGMPPRFVPSFSWGGADVLREYQFEKAVEVARLVMARRNIAFTSREEELFREVYRLACEIEPRKRS